MALNLRIAPGDDPDEWVARLQAPSLDQALAWAGRFAVRPPCAQAWLRALSVRRQHARKGRRVSMTLIWHAPEGPEALRAGLTGELQPGFMSVCRACSEPFRVSQRAIDEVRETYPDEPCTDAQAANIVDICERCADL